jgi:ribosomal-protein-alanine N-acetyltransferase
VDFVITAATKDDLDSILRLDRVCLDGFWSEESYLNELENDHSLMAVIRWEKGIIGVACMWLYWEEAHIVMLAIDPAHQNQGFGSLLVWHLLHQAHLFGAEWVVLEVRESNTKAIHLYRQFDFVPIGKRKEYYSNNKEDALVFWCKKVHTPEFRDKLYSKKQQILSKLQDKDWYYVNP